MTREASKKQVAVANDMETAVTGMAQLFPNLEYFMDITWSSGIGIRLVKNGLIVSNSEASHTPLDRSPFASLCGCGLRGCFDAVVGGNGLARRVIAETQMRGIALPEGMHPCAALDRAYVADEPWAVAIYELIVEGMGSFLATLQTTLQVPAIVWKGGFAQNALRLPNIEKKIRAAMRMRMANPEWEADLNFRFVPQPPDVIEDAEAFLGAAALALRMCG
jgi:predicted NBD/HSP70 family sugar kinase